MSKIVKPEAAHSTLGASKAEIWTNCEGAPREQAKAGPRPQSPYAAEGTRAHEIGEIVLRTGGWPLDVDPEMKDAVRVYIDHVQSLMRLSKKARLFIEQRLDLSSVHPKMFGTADAVIYFPVVKLLHVIDYKHGAGVPVEVKDNLQLQYYGLGSLLMLKRPVERIVLTIVQPRCHHPDGPVRSQEIHAFDMLDMAAYLKEKADKTEVPNAPLKSGSWCRWCDAAPTCPKLKEEAQALVKVQFSLPSSEVGYDLAGLATTLEKLDMVEDWARSVREFAYQEAMKGIQIPGFKLVAKRATRKWHSYVNANTLAEKFGGDKSRFLEMDLKSPAQVEKLLSRPEKEIVETLVEKVSSGLALVSESDNRPQAALRDAKADFGQISYAESGIFD